MSIQALLRCVHRVCWGIGTMTFYWSLKSIPELTQLPWRERWRAWFACSYKSFRHWQTWLAFIAAVAPIIAGGTASLLYPLVDPPETMRGALLTFLLPYVFGYVLSIPGLLLFSCIQIEVIRPYLRDYLARRNQVAAETTEGR